LLNRIDSLFRHSNTTVISIEVEVVNGADNESLKFPTASFVSSGFCIIFLHTDKGDIGIGEPSPYGGSIENTIKAVNKISNELKGKTLYDAWLYRSFDKRLLSAGYGMIAKQAVNAAISQCCVDILSKQLNVPAYKIFNPESDGIVPAYASGGMIYSDQPLDLYIKEALEYKNKGFNAWKFRPSTPK
jgi:L-alanine-DL-glutamate epimerase-like enolase superfamily enzyme